MSNLKKYNLFILVTSFAKLLVELFIPIILYKKDFSVREIILFLILKYLFCSILIPVTLNIGKRVSYTKIMLISSVMFSITYIYLNFIKHSIISLVLLAFIFSLYLVFYWTPRHIYALSIIEDKKVTDNVSLYQIFNIIGGIPATLIGAKILEYCGFVTLTIIVTLLMILSVLPLIKIKDVEIDKSINMRNIVKTFPKRNYAFIIIDQFRYLGASIFPLFIFLYIKSNLSYLGVINVISGIGSVIYIYILSKKMDKNKKDYLFISSIFLGVIYLLKISIKSSYIFLLIVFFEGVMKASLDTIVLRNTYAYGKNYEVCSYIGFIELLNNVSRTIFLTMFYMFDVSLKVVVIVSIIGIFVNGFVRFDDGKYGYGKNCD